MIELRTTGVSSTGAAVGREPSGRVVFVAGALPQELVRADIVEEKKRHVNARLTEVIEASPDRIEPACPAVAMGCGGCDLRHATPAGQRALKQQIVSGAITRIGGLEPVPLTTIELPAEGYRTTARCGVVEGRAGFRLSRSQVTLAVERCPVLHPDLEELLVEGRFDGATEVTLRLGARTGERLALVAPSAAAVDLPPDVIVVGADELRAGRRAWYHDEVAGRRWRISARSFFQARPDGAEALVGEVRRRVGEAEGPLIDLYGGVGLLAGTIDAKGPVTLVERSGSALADARINLGDHPALKLLDQPVERWKPSGAEVVLADPARSGLGAEVVTAVAATGCLRLVLVSCDAGAFGRDAGLLDEAGYELGEVTLIDMFPQTSHVEVISTFDRM